MYLIRQVLEQVGSAHHVISGDTAAVDAPRRPWELRSVIHAKFKSYIEEGRKKASHEEGHPTSLMLGLDEDGIRDSMDGAIELRSAPSVVILNLLRTAVLTIAYFFDIFASLRTCGEELARSSSPRNFHDVLRVFGFVLLFRGLSAMNLSVSKNISNKATYIITRTQLFVCWSMKTALQVL